MSHSYYRIHRNLCLDVSFNYHGKYFFIHDVKDFSFLTSDKSVSLILHSGDVYTFPLTFDNTFHVTCHADYTMILDANDPIYDYVSVIGEYVGEHAPDMEVEC